MGAEIVSVNCARCERIFVSDRTPMALDGLCMMCRPLVEVECSRCRDRCPGSYDGLKCCPSCRAGRLGEQQYEDKQRALYADLMSRGLILESPPLFDEPN